MNQELLNHAKRELNRKNYPETLADRFLTILNLVEDLSDEDLDQIWWDLRGVLKFENISPLTDDPTEWVEVELPITPPNTMKLWRNNRNMLAFSDDHGLTYYMWGDRNSSRTKPMMMEV